MAYIEAWKNADQFGKRMKDRISGFTGVVVAVTERRRGWCNGDCVQLALQCEELIDGKPLDEQWFDLWRLERVNSDASPTGQEEG